MQAVDAGHTPAYESVAFSYLSGDGVSQSDTLALEWREKGMALGDPDSKYGLAYQLYNGIGTSRDDAKAIALLEELLSDPATAYAEAKNILGAGYENGRGVEPDIEKAIALYKEAGDEGDQNARANLAAIYRDGTGGHGDPAQALELLAQLHENPDYDVFGSFGALYQYGIGVDTDLIQAAALYQEGAHADDPEAAWRLAGLYASGEGVAADTPQAEALYQQARRRSGSRNRLRTNPVSRTRSRPGSRPPRNHAILRDRSRARRSRTCPWPSPPRP